MGQKGFLRAGAKPVRPKPSNRQEDEKTDGWGLSLRGEENDDNENHLETRQERRGKRRTLRSAPSWGAGESALVSGVSGSRSPRGEADGQGDPTSRAG